MSQKSNVAERTFTAIFRNDKGGSVAYEIGENLDLQDALNATINNGFAPTKIILSQQKTPYLNNEKAKMTSSKMQTPHIGKHTSEEIKRKYKIEDKKLSELLHEGMTHEMEHTNDYLIAMAIAKDHIFENLNYYPKLKQMNLARGAMMNYMAAGGRLPKLPQQERLFHLPIEMAVYVPSTKNVDKLITPYELEKRVDTVKRTLASMFGGYTSAEFMGGYIAQNEKLVNEKIVRVVSYSTKDAFQENKKDLLKKIAEWAKEWGQESIGYEYEGDLFYVDSLYEDGGIITDELEANLKIIGELNLDEI